MLPSFVSTTTTLRSCFHGSHLFRRSISTSPISRVNRSSKFFQKHVYNNSKAPNLTVPSFREEIFKEKPNFERFGDGVKPRIRKQVTFTIIGSITAFLLAAELSNDETRFWSTYLKRAGWRLGEPRSDEMKRARYMNFHKTLQDSMNRLRELFSSLPLTLQGPASWVYVGAAQTFLDMTDGRRAAWAICGINGVIFLLWQFRRLKPMMYTGFSHHPLSGKAFTMLTSTFSHHSFIHLLFNSLALSSFGSAAVVYLGREHEKMTPYLPEASPVWHFFAFFVSAGLFSSLVSHVVSARFRFPRIIKELSAKTTESTNSFATTSRRRFFSRKKETPSSAESIKSSILPSLGASGAIYACVTLTALAFPTAQVTLVIPPSWPFPISWGVGGMVCIDILGILRGWRLFDHWAHLGGAAFGVLYYAYGPEVWHFFRRLAMQLQISMPGGLNEKRE